MRATQRNLSLLVAAAIAAGCGQKGSPPSSGDPPPPKAVDRLAPLELSEGTEKAWGLVLPKQLKIESRFKDILTATGDVPPEAVSNYVRARVREGKAVVGASQTLFERVKPSADPSRQLQIRIDSAAGGKGCRVTVRDVTPDPATLAPDQETQLKNVGLTPQGKLADPKHLQ